MPDALKKALADLKRLQATGEVEKKKRAEIESLPPAVILRARELRKKGKFRRQITKRTPKNLEWDEGELDCGHKTEVWGELTDRGNRECKECIEVWFRRQVKAGKKHS